MEYYTAIGIDVSDRTSKVCMMTKRDGKRRIVEETTVSTTKEGLSEYFRDKDRSIPVAFETGTHCRWMRRHIAGMGFRVYVANPAKLPTITKSNTKNDRNDSRELARLLLADPELLHPVCLRDEEYQRMMRLVKVRDGFKAMRTKATNMAKGYAKAMGECLGDFSPEKMPELNRSEWSPELESLLFPVIDVVETLNEKIKAVEAQIRALSQTEPFKEKVERVKEVYGVGDIIAPAFVACIGGDTSKFDKARDVGAYLGFTPRQDQSGEIDRQLHATKAGDKLMRRLLVEGANVIMKEGSKDTDLKLKGMRIRSRGGKIAKGKSKVAVARALAVTMTALLMHPERDYVALSEGAKAELEMLRREEARREMKKIS